MYIAIVVASLVGVYILKRCLSYSNKLPPALITVLGLDFLRDYVAGYVGMLVPTHSKEDEYEIDAFFKCPFNIPLLGSWEFIKMYLHGGTLQEMSARLGAKHGPVIFLRIAMDTPVIIIRTYDAIKETAKDLRLYGMTGTYLYRLAGEWVHRGISLADGNNWHKNRKFTIASLGKLGFNKKRLEGLASSECSVVAKNLIASKGQPVNIEKEITGAVANVTLQIVMSHRFDIYDPEIWKMKSAVFTVVSVLSHIQTYLDIAPWIRKFVGENSSSHSLIKTLGTFSVLADKVIEEHKVTLDETNPRDLVDAYLIEAKTPREGRDMSIANLRTILKDLVIGGLEPGPVMLSWLLLLIAEHPDVQDKMCAELDAVIGRERAPTTDDERSCHYTHAVIEETLRYVTLIPINRHFATMGATTFRGYHIPAGSVILADQHSLHHDPAVWGDPGAFRPDRFLGADGARLRLRVRAFGVGPRVCLAEAHSRTLLFLFVSGLLQRLKFRLPEGGRPRASSAYHVASRPHQTILVPQSR